MTARTAQIPSLRILPSEKKLIDRVAKETGKSVTDWARDELLRLAHEAEAKRKAEVPHGTERKRESMVVPKEPPKRKGLELDDETRGMLIAGYNPYSR